MNQETQSERAALTREIQSLEERILNRRIRLKEIDKND